MTLTSKQQQILDAILFLQSRGDNPTVREIAQLVGLNAPATVHKHLRALEEAGIIERTGKSRGIRVIRGSGIPVVGQIAAGQPLENFDLETEDVDPLMPGSANFPELDLEPGLFLRGASPGELVALEVRGESMIEAGILDGDHVIIRRQPTVEEGQIAAVTVDGAGTLKRWSQGSEKSRRSVKLSPANEKFEPLVVDEDEAKDVRVLGRYLGLIRRAQ